MYHALVPKPYSGLATPLRSDWKPSRARFTAPARPLDISHNSLATSHISSNESVNPFGQRDRKLSSAVHTDYDGTLVITFSQMGTIADVNLDPVCGVLTVTSRLTGLTRCITMPCNVADPARLVATSRKTSRGDDVVVCVPVEAQDLEVPSSSSASSASSGDSFCSKELNDGMFSRPLALDLCPPPRSVALDH
jgi:hypothetical protein